MNPFPYTADNKRYHTYAYFLKQKYGGRVARVPLDAGFTCPNRDGTKGTGGCAFCSPRGSGDQVVGGMDLPAQYAAGIDKLQKWPNARYIPYLQAFSGTYAPIERLREVYDQALPSAGRGWAGGGDPRRLHRRGTGCPTLILCAKRPT